MGLIRWLTKNWANTAEPTHPGLAPLTLAVPVPAAVETVGAIVRGMPRWRVEAADPTAGVMHMTRRTPVFRFVDDVTIRFTATADGTRVDAESRSRVGKGDLGQNRRNILELWRHVAAANRHAAGGGHDR